MLVHYHIEKSAGSSFRDLCRDYFGQDRSEALYGATSKSTSDRVRKIFFADGAQQRGGASGGRAQRYNALAAFLIRSRPAFFSTHDIVPLRNRLPVNVVSVAFFRDPVERLISHYNHWTLHSYVTGTFAEFYEQERFRNWQAQRFTHQQMQELSFVGLTEAFDDSIAIINAGLGTSLQPRHTNKTPWRPSKIKGSKLDPETRHRLAELNAADIELYAAVRERFSRDLEKAKQT